MSWFITAAIVGLAAASLVIVWQLFYAKKWRKAVLNQEIAKALARSAPASSQRWLDVEQAHFFELLKAAATDGWKIRVLDEQSRKELIRLDAPCNLRAAVLQLTRRRGMKQAFYRVQGIDDRGFAKHGVVIVVNDDTADEVAIH